MSVFPTRTPGAGILSGKTSSALFVRICQAVSWLAYGEVGVGGKVRAIEKDMSGSFTAIKKKLLTPVLVVFITSFLFTDFLVNIYDFHDVVRGVDPVVDDSLGLVGNDVLLVARLDDGDGGGRAVERVLPVVTGELPLDQRLEQPEVGHGQGVLESRVRGQVLQGGDLGAVAEARGLEGLLQSMDCPGQLGNRGLLRRRA